MLYSLVRLATEVKEQEVKNEKELTLPARHLLRTCQGYQRASILFLLDERYGSRPHVQFSLAYINLSRSIERFTIENYMITTHT